MARIGSMYGGFSPRRGRVQFHLPPDSEEGYPDDRAKAPPGLSPGGRVRFGSGGVSGENYQPIPDDIPDYATQEAPWYRVKQGDTMWDIANDFNTTLDSLLSRNPQIDNPNLINPNQLISLPLDARHREEELEDLKPGGEINVGNTVTVESGDTLWDIARKHDTTWQELQILNRIKDPNLIFPGQQIYLPGQPWENYPS